MKQALFPLNTVVFPGSVLPLKIFEQRYLNLVKSCMQQQSGFVIVFISEGREVGETPQIFSTGCYVEIIDWHALTDGLLGISIQAKHRVKLSNSSIRHDGLMLAEATPVESNLDKAQPLPESCAPLADTLKQLLEHPYAGQYKNTTDFTNVADICYRLAELLPISNRHKQLLLETETTEQMLNQLALHINALQS